MRSDSYNWLERSLHWIALEPRSVRELAFDLERRLFMRADATGAAAGGPPSDRPVYVCGLARSGTTILLRALARSDEFRSLTYRDMPFVMAPNLWRSVSRLASRALPPAERAHGDGIMVDYDSPEAFEEVFWRTFCPQPAGPDDFGAAQPDAETMTAFAEYRSVVAHPRADPGMPRRYLSKNNNNVMRLAALASEPTASVLVVYRDPVDAARSLFRQHQRFCATHAEVPFTRDYMKWLAHHEFGRDHKPFSFALRRMDRALSPECPDYWLDYWTAVHEHVLAEVAPRIFLVDHDRLCAQPVAMMAAVLAAIGTHADAAALAAEIRAPAAASSPPDEFDTRLLACARAVHENLANNFNNVKK